MRLSLLFFAAALCQLAIAAEPREVYYADLLTSAMSYDNGFLLVYDIGDLNVFGPDGSHLFDLTARIEGGELIKVEGAAADTDGAIAAAVDFAMEGTSRRVHGGIVMFEPSGRQVRFFDTGEYLPLKVAFGPDHTIWTLGWPGSQSEPWGNDFRLLQNFSQEGKGLGAYLPRSSFRAEADPIGQFLGGWELHVIGDRVGAVFYRSSVHRAGQPMPSMLWVETDLKGKELGRWNLGYECPPEAFTASGALYTSTPNVMSIFDRKAQTWRRAAIPRDGFLLGADGDSLVFLIRPNRLRWVPVGK